MIRSWLAGTAGLLMIPGLAFAQDVPISSHTTTTTTQTNPTIMNPTALPTTTTVQVEHSASQEDGMLTERTRTFKSEAVTAPVIVAPTSTTTTVERTVTVQPR